MEDEYTKAVTAELNARAAMYTAGARLLNSWSQIIESVAPAATKLLTAAVEEAISKATK